MTKQNMPRLTESQLFTIEALNRIQFFKWPNKATHAAMNRDDTEVLFYVGSAKAYKGKFSGVILLRGKFTFAHGKHPNWINSIITKEQFDIVDGWVQNSGAQPVSDECIVECKVDGPLGAIGYLPANVWNWERGGLTHWRYHKPSNADNTETVAMKDPAPCFARRSFSWVGCENGFIIPDRVKEAELTLLGVPIIIVLAEVDDNLQEQGGSTFRAAHIELNQVICNNTNQNITAHVIRYLPIDAREAADHE